MINTTYISNSKQGLVHGIRAWSEPVLNAVPQIFSWKKRSPLIELALKYEYFHLNKKSCPISVHLGELGEIKYQCNWPGKEEICIVIGNYCLRSLFLACSSALSSLTVFLGTKHLHFRSEKERESFWTSKTCLQVSRISVCKHLTSSSYIGFDIHPYRPIHLIQPLSRQ